MARKISFTWHNIVGLFSYSLISFGSDCLYEYAKGGRSGDDARGRNAGNVVRCRRRAAEQVGGDGREHVDPVRLWRFLLLRGVLSDAQVVPGLRPVHPRLRRLLQGHWRQHRRPLRPANLLPGGPRAHVARPPRRRRPVLRRVPPNVALGDRVRPPPAAGADVPLHAAGGARPDVLQYRERGHRGRELPG